MHTSCFASVSNRCLCPVLHFAAIVLALTRCFFRRTCSRSCSFVRHATNQLFMLIRSFVHFDPSVSCSPETSHMSSEQGMAGSADAAAQVCRTRRTCFGPSISDTKPNTFDCTVTIVDLLAYREGEHRAVLLLVLSRCAQSTWPRTAMTAQEAISSNCLLEASAWQNCLRLTVSRVDCENFTSVNVGHF